MPYCPNCGASLEKEVTFCPYCGAPIKAAQRQQPKQPSTASQVPRSETRTEAREERRQLRRQLREERREHRREEKEEKQEKEEKHEKQEKHEKGEKKEKEEKREERRHSALGPLIAGLTLLFLGLSFYLQITGYLVPGTVWTLVISIFGIVIFVGIVYAAVTASRRHPRT
ncbi:MAG: zinc ribbon domain-containing protein [Candidatus Atabeyarchaeum deiterrae]